MYHAVRFSTSTRINLFFVGRSMEEASCGGLFFEDPVEADEHIADNLTDEDYKVYSFWLYLDPDSGEVAL